MFIGMHHVAKTVSVLTFMHLDVNGRLQHVAGLAETLQASTAKLKDEACKAPLLTKISETFPRDCPREDTPPSSSRGQPAASGGATSSAAATFDAAPQRRSRSKASEGTSQQSTQGSASSAKQSATNSVKVSTKPPSSSKAAVPTKGRAPAATPSVTAAAAARAAKQRAQAVAELDHLIRGDCTAFKSYKATDTVAVPATSAKSSKDTAIAVAQSQVADDQRTVELLTSTAAKKKCNAEDKKACYFEAHAHALEFAIDREDTGLDLNAALDDVNRDLPTLEYEYRSAGEEANRAETAAATATNKLQKLTRRLAKITPKGPPEIEVANKCVIS
ncbi:unnamed protein product [Peronospora effusa]|nr:unnamed protein product [Peronospora effusa]